MRLEQMSYFVAAVQHGSLRAAAKAEHISVPALSEAIDKLERELGLPLLERTRKGVHASDDGQRLMAHIVEVLDAAERLRRCAKDGVSESIPRVSIGTVGAATASVLLPAVATLREELGAQVSIDHGTHDQVLDNLRQGSIDIALVNLVEAGDARSGATVYPSGARSLGPILTSPIVAVLPAGHELANAAQVSARDLLAWPMVMMEHGYAMHRVIQSLRRSYEEAPVLTACVAQGAEIGKSLVANGLGITVLPEYSVVGDPLHTSGALVTRRIPELGAVSMHVLTRPGAATEVMRAATAALAQAAGRAQELAA